MVHREGTIEVLRYGTRHIDGRVYLNGVYKIKRIRDENDKIFDMGLLDTVGSVVVVFCRE